MKINGMKYLAAAGIFGILAGITNHLYPFLTPQLIVIIFTVTFAAIFLYIITSKFLTKKILKGAPFVQSSKNVIKTMIEMAGNNINQKIADIGSGDAKIVIAFAKKGFKVTGVEINPLLASFSKLKIFTLGLSNKIRIQNKSFWNTDLSDFDVITVFGIPFIMKDLEKKLLKELKPGAKVISNKFKFPNWEYKQERNEVYLYEKTRESQSPSK